MRRSDALERVVPALAALAATALVLLPAAGRSEAGLAHVAAAVAVGVLVGVAVGATQAGRARRRLEHLSRSARSLAAGEAVPYIAPARADVLGELEAHFAEMARGVVATIGELRLEQERMEAILRGMVEGVVVTDLSMRVVLLNARARELLGIPQAGGEIGRPLVELVRDPALQESARDLREGAAVVSQDITLGGPGGRLLQLNAARLTGDDGRAFGFVLVLHDVSELRRLEVIRRDFVANVSHELRTPLTAIKGYAETLLGPAGDDRETARRFLAVIDRHSERLGRLTDDLLALSDLELGRAPLHLAPVDLEPTVEDVIQILAERAARTDVELAADVDAATPPVLADGDRLRQVLINLIDNAIKFTPAGGRVSVHAAPGVRPGMVEIAVHDSGIGIPAQDLPRLTERFFRVDKARSRALGGTGLGLAIVKHLIQAHGGTLDISSAIGQGTTVRVGLPAATAPARASGSKP